MTGPASRNDLNRRDCRFTERRNITRPTLSRHASSVSSDQLVGAGCSPLRCSSIGDDGVGVGASANYGRIVLIYSMSVSRTALSQIATAPSGWTAPSNELFDVRLRECARSAPTSAAARSTRRCFRGKPTLRCATPSLGPSSPPSGPLSRRSCSAARSSASRATPDSRPHRWVRKGPLRSGRPARRRDRGRGARGSSDGTWLG